MRLARLIAMSALLVTVPTVPALFAQTNSNARSADRMVCKTRPRTGTRFRSQTCRTAREWAELEESHKKGHSELLMRPAYEGRKGE
jgi:hypothetical protein